MSIRPVIVTQGTILKGHFTFVFSVLVVCLFAQKEERKISNIHSVGITCLAVSYDGSRALTGGVDNRADLWNTINGNKIIGFGAQDKEITDVKFNGDESLFATASRSMSIVIWDGLTRKPRKILKENSEILAIAFQPFTNNLISVSSDGKIKLWDALSGKMVRENYGALDETDITSATAMFSADGRYWGVETNKRLFLFSTEGSMLAALPVKPSKTGKPVFDFSPDGSIVVYVNASEQVATCSLLSAKPVEIPFPEFKNITVVGFAQNTHQLIIGNAAGKIRFYDLQNTRVIQEFVAHDGALVAAGLSLDGDVLITAGTDLALKRWSSSGLHLGFKGQPLSGGKNLVLTSLSVSDENQNGLLDAGEKASVSAVIKNADINPVYNITLNFKADQRLEGLDIPASVFVGNIPGSTSKTILIPLNVAAQLASGSTGLTVDVMSSGIKLTSGNLTLQTGSSVNAGLTIKSFKFYSPTGRSDPGQPVTLLISIENITRIVAENVQVFYKLPASVSAIDKSKETIAKLLPGASTSISIQFIVDKNFTGKEVVLGLDISGVAYSNAADLKMELPMGQNIGTQQDMLAMLESQTASTMRGSMTIAKVDVQGVSIEQGRYVALIIGIDHYEGNWNKLNNATHDAKAVEDALKKNYNFSVVHTLYDKAATRQAIITEFEWLVSNLKPSDNLVIFYSGHGDFKESLNRGFWVPVDATTNSTSNFISNPDLQTFLGSIKAKHTLLISDACFSGDIFRGSENKNDGPVNEKYYSRVNNLSSRQALTSGGLEPVMDGGREGHSVFTYYFLKILKENTQKYIDAEQLFDALKIPVVNNSNQAPKFSHIKNTGDEGGEFIFYKK